MSIVRWILGRIILLLDWLTRPSPPQRPAEEQQALDRQTANLALYQFEACPFCVKTRRAIRRLGLNIALHDARNDATRRQELERNGGRIQVPCLRIQQDDGSVRWLYESTDIINYLQGRFGQPA